MDQGEMFSVKPGQSTDSPDPEESISRLNYGVHFIRRKPVFNGEILAKIAAFRLARIEREPQTREHGQDDDAIKRRSSKPGFVLHTSPGADPEAVAQMVIAPFEGGMKDTAQPARGQQS